MKRTGPGSEMDSVFEDIFKAPPKRPPPAKAGEPCGICGELWRLGPDGTTLYHTCVVKVKS